MCRPAPDSSSFTGSVEPVGKRLGRYRADRASYQAELINA